MHFLRNTLIQEQFLVMKEPSVSRSFFIDRIIERRSCFVILDGHPLSNLVLSTGSDGPICLLQCLFMEAWL